MASFTIELRKIVETIGLDEVKKFFTDYELSDYLTPDEIAVINTRGTWNKDKLANKIINHYFMREIGVETVALFKLRAKVAMQEIMEEKLPLIYSAALKYDPLKNVDYYEEYQGNKHEVASSAANSTSTGNGTNNSSGLSVNSDTPQGQISKAEILAGKYASSTSASETTDTTQSTSTGNTMGNSDTNEDSDYTKHIHGNSGITATNQKMIQQYRENIVAIDREIINSLNTLFMGVYNM